uniref:HTTM-like domain-containing protein n=1 Tax=Timema cristinae TaxID=61476 RepID=A0A7R9CR75_TIMCR|nr:unnamed protein product [Timema cristinae]
MLLNIKFEAADILDSRALDVTVTMRMSSRRKKAQKIDMSDISKPIQPFSQESTSRAYTSDLWESVLMVLDVVEERGLANADIKWGNPNECRFPLFDVLKPLPLDWMCIIHLIMWAGAFGIMLGFFFKWSCVAFIAPYWYIVLLDKSTWNNHSYLYGLISILLLGTDANHGLFGRVRSNSHVPLWNYMVLRFQFFVLYFFAGLKKMDKDWIEGHSLSNLSSHWVFEPFKLLLSPEQVDYWIIHQFGFLLDLTISFWLFFDKTRPYALIFCTSFHLMNSRIFSIGMFPYVCLAMQPIFCHDDWPRHLTALFNFKRQVKTFPIDAIQENELPTRKRLVTNLNWKHHLTAILLLCYGSMQCFLPYSHFITKGYNNWTKGLYGYSWDMMVHSWDTILVVVKVVDNNTGKEHFIDPDAWVQTNRWSKHADMIVQYAHCIKHNLLTQGDHQLTSDNISIFIDVWCSLNGRFQQRMFDPKLNLLQVSWSPFIEVTWLMPLLTEFSLWRWKIKHLEEDIVSWSNYTDSLFVADFPAPHLNTKQFDNAIGTSFYFWAWIH